METKILDRLKLKPFVKMQIIRYLLSFFKCKSNDGIASRQALFVSRDCIVVLVRVDKRSSVSFRARIFFQGFFHVDIWQWISMVINQAHTWPRHTTIFCNFVLEECGKMTVINLNFFFCTIKSLSILFNFILHQVLHIISFSTAGQNSSSNCTLIELFEKLTKIIA